LKPPEPVGMPWGRTHPADISFPTSRQPHCGHFGFGGFEETTNSSKQAQQALHWYS
jgi:hypothetical protein